MAQRSAASLSRAVAWRLRFLRDRLRSLPVEAEAWLGDRSDRARYPTLDESQLRRRSRSETCFIFGSGQSLDEITAAEWQAISRHNTMAFNYFMRSRFVRVDIHLVGEIVSPDGAAPSVWRPFIREYGTLIEENPFYADTILGVQEGLRAYQSNRLVSSGVLRPGRELFRYRRIGRGEQRAPSAALSDGLVHGAGTLVGCVNLAVILGFREIVLAGVDLYDRRYFGGHTELSMYSASDSDALAATDRFDQGQSEAPHLTANTMVRYLDDWRSRLAARGTTLSVYNPRSLLAQVLPVKDRVA